MMSRAETIKTERRRRDTDGLGGKRRKLAWDTSKADNENFVYRWVNDEGNRLHDLTVSDDWEVVPDRSATLKADGTGMGAEIAVPVGVGEHGRPMRAVLLRKSKDWHNDDQMAAMRRIDEQEAAIKQGASPGVEAEGLRKPDNGAPISIRHGSRA